MGGKETTEKVKAEKVTAEKVSEILKTVDLISGESDSTRHYERKMLGIAKLQVKALCLLCISLMEKAGKK